MWMVSMNPTVSWSSSCTPYSFPPMPFFPVENIPPKHYSEQEEKKVQRMCEKTHEIWI